MSQYEDCGISTVPNIKKMMAGGGNYSSVGDWPWVALIYIRVSWNESFQCGGVLISDQHVLTAAHCFDLLRHEFQ